MPEYRILIKGVEGAEIEGESLRLFIRKGLRGLYLRHTRSYHPPNDRWHHVELHRDRTAVVVLRDEAEEEGMRTVGKWTP